MLPSIVLPRALTGVVPDRKPLTARLNAWRKHTPLNPYWTELHWQRRSLAMLAASASGRMLDVGVGERPYAELFRGRVAPYVGLEYPPTADRLNPDVWQHLDRVRGVIDVWGDGGALPFTDGSFDTLLALEVLEHVPEPDVLVRDFVRVLRPRGRLLVSVPSVAPLHQLPRDFHRFTPNGLRGLLERNGLLVERLEPRGNFASVVGSLRAQHFLRVFGAAATLADGSVRLSRVRAPFVLPVVALIQLVYRAMAAVSRDTTCALGYAVVARKA